MHPAREAIEALQAKDCCPRLHIDVTHEHAVCPDFVREKWQQRLVIDLDLSYPLELEFTEIGVEANLSFGGYVTRCVFPFAAIYVVSDRETGRGRVLHENVPAALREQFGLPPGIDASLTAVRDDEAKRPGRRRKRRRAKQPAGPKLAVEPAPSEAQPAEAETMENTEAESSGEVESSGEPDTGSEAKPGGEAEVEKKTEAESVKTRRAAFQVIDGGG